MTHAFLSERLSSCGSAVSSLAHGLCSTVCATEAAGILGIHANGTYTTLRNELRPKMRVGLDACVEGAFGNPSCALIFMKIWECIVYRYARNDGREKNPELCLSLQKST
ncbi:hypothetical protein AVEN_223455-1 [Araneus ventricosus]|uniref:Uncharacterized protein n=1 Tax=Araneus ventricosus TaxID=182803 RepID=A0A4Y2ESV2_ARAVE|nr:hypothetical protein AVEN_223455-1 [Araneus ventricosus]